MHDKLRRSDRISVDDCSEGWLWCVQVLNVTTLHCNDRG